MKKFLLCALLPALLFPCSLRADSYVKGDSVLLTVDNVETIKSDTIYMTVNDVTYEWFEQDDDGRIWLEKVTAVATLKCNTDSIMFIFQKNDDEQSYPWIEHFSPTAKTVIQDYKDSVMIKLADAYEFEYIDYIELWIQYGSSDHWEVRPVSPIIKLTDYAREDLRALISETNKIESSPVLKRQSSHYYDLQGRRLAAPPAKGVYVEDGRLKIRD